jgi:2-oxoglutarate dehydrogenase E2 component (dihydrolipoamide succinyltransferase)
MTIEIKVPQLGESVSEAAIAKLHKKAGDAVKADELIVELETDKVTLEVNAPKDGVISDVKVKEGDTVKVGDLIAIMQEGLVSGASKPAVQNAATQTQVALASKSDASQSSHPLSPAPKKISSGE